MNTIERLGEIQRQIEGNDPDLTTLSIGRFSYFPSDGEWERDGKGIGRNKHIKKLRFGNNLGVDLRYHNVSRGEFEAFCTGLAGNDSVEHLKMCSSDLFGGEIFNMLTPFFEQNNKLRRLTVGGVDDISPNEVRFLSQSLARFNTLREFRLAPNSRISDHEGEGESLIRALEEHSELTTLDLVRTKVEGRAMEALAALLSKPNSFLADLTLSACLLDDNTAEILAVALGGTSTTLRGLNLAYNGNVTFAGWRVIFAQTLNPQSLLEKLRLKGNSIDDTTANLLVSGLADNTHLKVLDLGFNNRISNDGWWSVFDFISSPRCMLEELILDDNRFGDEHVTYLANLLASNCGLKKLSLGRNSDVTASGWGAVSAVLQNPDLALETVNLRWNPIDDDALVSFGNSLTHNSKLKELLLEYEEDDHIIADGTAGWEAFSNVLCNKSSVEATFNSNHTLQRILQKYEESLLPSELRALLQLNEENTKAEAARRKILQVHFSGGDFNMLPFVDMDLKTLPHVVAWMARDKCGSSLLYQFVRNTNLFVDVGGGARSEAIQGDE